MFVQSPNLPEADAALAVVSGTYWEIVQSLNQKGIQTILVQPFSQLSKPVCTHADMVLHHLGGNQLLVAENGGQLQAELEQEGFQVTVSNVCISDQYPRDIPFNAARIGNRLFARQNAVAPEIGRYCMANQIAMVPVKQGYAKCSTVIVDEISIITEDPSIASAGKMQGMDVLKITAGYVKLEGYPHGFLGGACGLIGKRQLAFTGLLYNHPDYDQIATFCRKRNVELIMLTNGPLIDIGGILTLKTRQGKVESNT